VYNVDEAIVVLGLLSKERDATCGRSVFRRRGVVGREVEDIVHDGHSKCDILISYTSRFAVCTLVVSVLTRVSATF